MSTFLHQIFYVNNKFDTESKLPKLAEFMLTNNKKSEIVDAVVIPEPRTVNIVPEIKENAGLYFPKKQNPLFWCIYISIYGYPQYLAIDKKYSTTEMEEKQKIIEFLKTSGSKLKQANRRVTKCLIQEWMSDFLAAKKMEVPILQVFSVYYGRKIYMYNEEKGSYLKYPALDTESEPIIIYKNKDGNFGIDMNTTAEKIKEVEAGIQLEDVDKPLKGVSSYKMTDLTELSTKCGLPLEADGRKLKKPELYVKIWFHLK